MSGTELPVDVPLAKSRLKRFHEEWDRKWTGVDVVVLLTGRQDDERTTPKSCQFHLWAIGYLFPDTLMVFFKDQRMFVLSGKKKLNVLQQLADPEKSIFVEKRSEAENKIEIDKIIKSIRSSAADSFKIGVGRLVGKSEEATGPFGTQVDEQLKSLPSEYITIQMNLMLCRLLLVHDTSAIASAKSSGILSCRLLKDILLQRVVDILDRELAVTHSTLVAAAEASLDDPKRQERWKSRFGLDPLALDFVYATVQSGSQFDLKPSAAPINSNLHLGSGCIILGTAGKYADYVTNVARTLLLDPTPEQKKAYQTANECLDHLIKHLKPGVTFKSVYEATRDFLTSKSPDLVDFLARSVGHAIGLEFRDSNFVLTAKCDEIIQEGMTIHASVPLSNISSSPSNFSILLSDTILVTNESPKIVTKGFNRGLAEVSYELQDAPKEKKSTKPTPAPKSASGPSTSSTSETTAEPSGIDSVVLRDRLRSRSRKDAAAVGEAEFEKMMRKQKSLREAKSAELRDRFRDGADFSQSKKQVRKLTSLNAYRDAAEFPKDLKPNKLFVDMVRESILVPIEGHHVPFHIGTIRNVFHSHEEDKKIHTLRINFQVPGSSTLGSKSDDNPLPDVTSPNSVFVKELIYRSVDPTIPILFRNLRELQKRAKTRETNQELDQVVHQQPIQLNRTGRRVILKNCMVKHGGTTGRRVVGTLEAHGNGLRYSPTRAEVIDINYANIKHAFFQPADRELILLIHFHLKNPVVLGKKKTVEIQFYQEVGNQADDLDQKKGRSTYDPDEIAEEERELENKQRLNAEFKKFVEGLEEMAKLEFEVPYRELQFTGVPRNSSVTMMPSANCLVQLAEWPSFVLTLEDVEVISLERVIHGLRHFDLVFVFKDYSKPVRTISTIPMESLDTIKRWLTEMDLVWYEGKGNLNWSSILKAIRGDIEAFAEDGGFAHFLGEGSDVASPATSKGSPTASAAKTTEMSTDSDEDQDYRLKDSESADESFESESEGSSEEESLAEESSGSVAEDSEEEEGLSWDELEREAVRDDRKRGFEPEEEEEEKRKKRRKT